MALSARVKATQGATVKIPDTEIELPCRSDEAHPLVPKIQERYKFRETLVRYVAWAIGARKNVLLTGDAGVGKSSLIEQLAALTNTPLYRVNLHGETDTTLFVGRDFPTEVDGVRTMVYREGILARAMREGHWLLLDEIDAALQPVLFVLQQVLEPNGKLMLEDTEHTIVEKHPGFRVFATANTVGKASKNRLLYSGTMGRMNEATLDRFGCVVHVDYLDKKDELAVINDMAPETDNYFLRAIVDIAHEVRNDLNNDALSCTFSTRRCIDWAQAMSKFHPLDAARITIMDKLSMDDGKAIEGIIQRFFGDGA